MTALAAPAGRPHTVATGDIVKSRDLRGPIVYLALGLIVTLWWGLGTGGGQHSTFTFATSGDFFALPAWRMPTRAICLILGIATLAVGGYAFWRAWTYRSKQRWVMIVAALAFVLAFLVWAITVPGEATPKVLAFTGLLSGGVVLAIPLIFGSLSGVLCERSGVTNIAIEGQLLGGAFMAAIISSVTHNAWIGVIAAMLGGLFVSWILSVFAIKYFVNQIIVGVVINTLILGLTSYMYSTVMSETPALNTPVALPTWSIPGLAQIPILGPTLFNQTALVYIMWVVVIAIQIMLFRSRWGLRLRSVGEHPEAADTVGINVNRTRWRAVLLAGLVAGMGGAFLTIGSGLPFQQNMSAGKGFIALAAMIFGRWSPAGALGAALLFGFTNQLQLSLSTAGSPVPSQFLGMLPYIVTIIAVAGIVGRVRMPAADGTPYIKGQ